MHNKFSAWLSLFAFLALFVAQAAAQGTVDSGNPQLPGMIKATRVKGKVRVKDVATNVERTLPVGAESSLSQGSIVNTEADSGVVLLFSNGASINLAASSELNIITFTQNPFEAGPNYEPSKATDEPSVSNTSLMLTHGELVGNVKKLRKEGPVKSNFVVATPVGAAGIRGTTFRIRFEPLGNGRVNFILTTVEGNVELQIGSGTITTPQGVEVKDSKEVVLTNVSIDTTTNQVVANTAGGQVIPVAAAPPSTDAPVLTVQQVQAVAQQLAQAVANTVFTTPSNNPPSGPGNNPPPDQKKEEKKEETPPPPSTNNTNITNPL